jgi:hypothetical protein
MGAREAGTIWAVRALGAAALLALASGCAALSPHEPNAPILVVDASGAPVQGAVAYPDYEYSSSQHQYTKGDIEALSSDAQGRIHVDIEDFLWNRDACYHFVVRRAGYEDASLSISKELAPPVIKVVLVPRSGEAPAQ